MFIPLSDDVEKDKLPATGFLLVGVNLLVLTYTYRLMFEDPDHLPPFEFFFQWGLVDSRIESGHFWQFLTHMFLHADFFHFMGNMLALWTFMWTLELFLGGWQFLALYVLSGLVAAVAQLVATWGDEIPMVGASGAIAGVMGAYTVRFGPMTTIRGVIWFFGKFWKVEVPAALFGLIWLGLQFHGASTSPEGEGGVAYFAHAGGFLMGMVFASIIGEGRYRVVTDFHDGAKHLVKVGEEQVQVVEQEIEVDTTPESCDYCHTPFTEDCRIAETLFRCANPDCKRLCYIQAPRGAASQRPVESGV